MHGALDDAVCLQLSQLLGQHLLRNAGHPPLQVGKALNLAAKEVEQDDQLPSPLQHAETGFDINGRAQWRVSLAFDLAQSTYFLVGTTHRVSL